MNAKAITPKNKKQLEEIYINLVQQECKIIDILCSKANQNSLYFDLHNTLDKIKNMKKELEKVFD